MKTITTFLTSILLAFAAYPATILQEQGEYAGIFDGPYFKGQSFQAEDPFLLSIGVGVRVFNPSQIDRTVNLSLYSGLGMAGPLIAHRTITPPRVVQWLDFDMTGVVVEPGKTYTFTIQALTRYWGARYNQWSYPNGDITDDFADRVDYPQGDFLDSRGFLTFVDLTFRVVPVPEPVSALLLLAGLVGLWCMLRTNNSKLKCQRNTNA